MEHASATEELVSRAQDGSNEAMAALFEQYAPRVARYYRKHGLNREHVDDCVQETMTRMISALQGKKIMVKSFEGWLFATARNVQVDLIRSIIRLAQKQTALSDEPAFDEPDALEARDTRRILIQVLRQLPRSVRRPLTLRHKHGFSYRQIAERLGISENAVGLRIYRARRKIQERLADQM